MGLVLATVFVGAFMQRVTGFGFALAVSPALIVILGPFDGVMLVNGCAIVTAGLVISRVWRDIEWQRFRLLILGALLGVPLGTFAASVLDGRTLELTIAIVLVVALTASLVFSRSERVIDGASVRLGSGFVSGVMNSTAGIGGPAITVYSVLASWPQRSFAATLQPYFMTLGAASFVGKLIASGGDWPDITLLEWGLIVAMMIVGILAGEWASRYLSARVARIAVICLSYIGAIVLFFDALAK